MEVSMSQSNSRRVPAFCPLCASRCGCEAVVEDGRLLAIEPDPAHPTGKALCAKGRASPALVEAPDRLLYPVRRTRRKGDPIRVDDAFPGTRRWTRQRRQCGELHPRAVPREICAWHRQYARAFTTGTGIGMPDYARAGCILLWGHNPSTSLLAAATRIAEARARGDRRLKADPWTRSGILST